MDWGSIAVLAAAFGIGGFLMCVGAVSTTRWLTRRLRRRKKPAKALYPPRFNLPPEPQKPVRKPVLPLRPGPGPRDWKPRGTP
jgi:hypothetical protein